MEEGGDGDNDDSLPRQVHVGLSIDSSVQTETSSLSDFEEGMPLWAKSPPRSSNDLQDGGPHLPLNLENDNNHDDNDAPMEELQIPMPQRMHISLDNGGTPQTLTQRSKGGGQAVVSLPIIPMVRREDNCGKDPFPLQQHARRGQKLMRLFCAVLALGLMAVSLHPLEYSSWESPDDRPDLPTFETQSIPQLATNGNRNLKVRRSSVAFARASSELPVFPSAAANDDDEVFPQISNSSPLVSFLGGCAFVAILVETGWKGYQKSKMAPRKGQTQAIRRLYK